MITLSEIGAAAFKAIEARALTPGQALRELCLKEGTLPGKDALIESQAEAQSRLSESLRTDRHRVDDATPRAREARGVTPDGNGDVSPPRRFEERAFANEKMSQLEEGVKDYEQELRRGSPTYNGKLDPREFKITEPGQNKLMRSEYNENKERLRQEWERIHNQPWPRYTEDVYDEKTGTKIRRKGDDYDGHHCQPLELGGKNTADNLTPMHARDHYDHRGIHARSGALHRLKEFC